MGTSRDRRLLNVHLVERLDVSLNCLVCQGILDAAVRVFSPRIEYVGYLLRVHALRCHVSNQNKVTSPLRLVPLWCSHHKLHVQTFLTRLYHNEIVIVNR